MTELKKDQSIIVDFFFDSTHFLFFYNPVTI